LDVLDEDAVIEVPCYVDANGPRPLTADPLPGHAAGLVCAVKAVERDVIAAAGSGSRSLALRALATHPLVDSVPVARRLLDGYQSRIPALQYLR
jgi:6-phospho-beta-glucosidase